MKRGKKKPQNKTGPRARFISDMHLGRPESTSLQPTAQDPSYVDERGLGLVSRTLLAFTKEV